MSYTRCGYKTAWGRVKWPNRDPIGERGGKNLYCFVQNDPLRRRDPDGRSEPNTVYHASIEVDQLKSFQVGLEWSKAVFIQAASALCPQDACPCTFSSGGGNQQCTAQSCKQQVQELADALADAYSKVFTSQYNQHGNIRYGWDGNDRATCAPEEGLISDDAGEGYGLKCTGWQDLTTQKLFDVEEKYRQQGKQCFRGARVGKPQSGSNFEKILNFIGYSLNHSWVVIYGPCRGALNNNMYHTGEYDLVLDPWPSGGMEIIPTNPYEVSRWDGAILW